MAGKEGNKSMARPWIKVFRFNGWPANTTIHIEVADGQNGPLYTGQIPLLMRKDDDLTSEQSLQMSANVQNGVWDLPATDFTSWQNEKFDTLVFDCNGYKVPRTFRTLSGPSQQKTSPKPAEKKEEKKLDDLELLAPRDPVKYRPLGPKFFPLNVVTRKSGKKEPRAVQFLFSKPVTTASPATPVAGNIAPTVFSNFTPQAGDEVILITSRYAQVKITARLDDGTTKEVLLVF
jgi:hypothetical protein